MISIEEMKNYLRADGNEDDELIQNLLNTAQLLCRDVARCEIVESSAARMAIMYAAAYLYEHREEADHHQLMITLRSLLFGERRYGF